VVIKRNPYFEKIRNEVGWKDVLRILGIKIKKSRKSYSFRTGNYIVLCPFHKERRASLHFFNNSGQYHCYGCGAHGDVFDFVCEYAFARDKIRTYRWFRKNFSIPLPWELKNRSKKL